MTQKEKRELRRAIHHLAGDRFELGMDILFTLLGETPPTAKLGNIAPITIQGIVRKYDDQVVEEGDK